MEYDIHGSNVPSWRVPLQLSLMADRVKCDLSLRPICSVMRPISPWRKPHVHPLNSGDRGPIIILQSHISDLDKTVFCSSNGVEMDVMTELLAQILDMAGI